MSSRIAVAIPCYNEEATIVSVIKHFKNVLPSAEIYVFNNNSTDKSEELAVQASAKVVRVRRQGKGYVMRTIFDVVVADILIIVDGDGTYVAEDVVKLIEPVEKGEADMVVGNRLDTASRQSLADLNRLGNKLIVQTINFTFGTQYKDVLSGYRVLSRRFVERVPLLTPKFETETELTLQALEEGLQIVELPVQYRARPDNSPSKLRPFHDGGRIMLAIAMLLRDHRPLCFYGFLGGASLFFALCFAVLKACNLYGITHLSDSLLAAGILLFSPVGFILLGVGFVLSAINTKFRELKQIMFRNKSTLTK